MDLRFWLNFPNKFLRLTKVHFSYKRSEEQHLLSDHAFYIFQVAVILGSKVFGNFDCKWNPEARQFEMDRSKWNLYIRCCHLICRVTFLAVFVIYGVLCMHSEKPCSYIELAFYIISPIFLMASIVVNIRTFFHPGLISTVLNAIKSLNEQYGKLCEDEIHQQKRIHYQIYMLIFEILAGPVCGFIAVLKVLELELLPLLTAIVDICQIVLPSADRFTIHVLCTINFSFMMIGEFIMWGVLGLQLIPVGALLKHCLKDPKIFTENEGNMYRQLQIVRNIITEEMFTWEILWFVIFTQLVITCIIFFDSRLYTEVTAENRIIVLGMVGIALLAFAIISNIKVAFELISSVMKASEEWKYEILKCNCELGLYERRFLKSCGPLGFDLAQCFKCDSVLIFRILQDYTFNLAITLLKAYN